jgi:diguanylate cyclase (GGDEF)-like protein/PAS domain S-box-containing protein
MILPASVEKPLLLLVDDMPANIHFLAASMGDLYRIKIATSGQKALDIAAQVEKPDLILLDVMMPEMNGIAVLKHLRANPETWHIPVIFVSADVSEQTQLDGLSLGADDYLTKPVVVSILLVRVQNILERKRAQAQLRLASHVYEHSGEAIMVTDSENKIISVNPAFTQMTGYELEEIYGKNPRFLSSGRTTKQEYEVMWKTIQEASFWQGEMWDRNKDGKVYPKLLIISVVRNKQGKVDYYIGSFTDITQQKLVEERIQHIAHHDPLTQLPNRLYLQVSLQQFLTMAHRNNEQIALMFIDLDRFKVINDTLGHHVGDELLVEVANRLKITVRECDVVARLGGDEFVIAVMGKNVTHIVATIAEKILHNLNQTYVIENHSLHTTPSIGVAIYPKDGNTTSTLMKNADSAMYHAKALGRNNVQYFSKIMQKNTSALLALENDLYEAVKNEQFYLNYQPQIDSATKKIIGVEALLRWEHPTLGNIAPNTFIPIAEETGLILKLGEWVLNTACKQLHDWKMQGICVRMAVNLSMHQLRSPNLLNLINNVLAENQLEHGDLELEITESVAMNEPDKVIDLLYQLREIGVELAIDDFGTGYSSLAYLKLLPIQRLKIDKSFVADIEKDGNDAAICNACIALAYAMGIEVVAEGVETQGQLNFIIASRSQIIQGFFFHKPMSATDLLQYF